jgi:hypothetical protein
MWLGAEAMTLEPFWPYAPIRPEESLGYSVALTAGEIAGAGVEGSWVACRSPIRGGGVRCAVIARLRDAIEGPSAYLTLGEETRETALQRILVPGIGSVAYAIVEFPHGRLDDPFDGTVARIPGRRGA